MQNSFSACFVYCITVVLLSLIKQVLTKVQHFCQQIYAEFVFLVRNFHKNFSGTPAPVPPRPVRERFATPASSKSLPQLAPSTARFFCLRFQCFITSNIMMPPLTLNPGDATFGINPATIGLALSNSRTRGSGINLVVIRASSRVTE
jgi:hypothetical protein